MPNWCSNSFYVWGDREEVYKFYLDLITATSDSPDFEIDGGSTWRDRDWIGRIFLQAGYTMEEIENRGFETRGTIGGISLSTDEYGELGVQFDEETAWAPNDESIGTLLKEKYSGLDFVFIAEEPGCDIYVNSDTDGRKFKEKWVANWDTDGCCSVGDQHYESDEECAEDLEYELGLSKDEILQALGNNDWPTLNEAFCKKNPAEEAWFSIHRFESC